MSRRAAWRLESLGFREVYDYVPGKVDWLAAGLPREGKSASVPLAGDLAREVRAYRMDTPVSELREEDRPWVVVTEEGIVLGRVPDPQVAKGTVGENLKPGPSTVRASEDLADLTHRMRHAGRDSILVTTPEGRLIGVLDREEAEQSLRRG